MCAAQSIRAEAAPAEKLKVFISYSRKDLAFAVHEKQARETCRAMKLQKIDCLPAKGE
jgi:hypothetical protein